MQMGEKSTDQEEEAEESEGEKKITLKLDSMDLEALEKFMEEEDLSDIEEAIHVAFGRYARKEGTLKIKGLSAFSFTVFSRDWETTELIEFLSPSKSLSAKPGETGPSVSQIGFIAFDVS